MARHLRHNNTGLRRERGRMACCDQLRSLHILDWRFAKFERPLQNMSAIDSFRSCWYTPVPLCVCLIAPQEVLCNFRTRTFHPKFMEIRNSPRHSSAMLIIGSSSGVAHAFESFHSRARARLIPFDTFDGGRKHAHDNTHNSYSNA